MIFGLDIPEAPPPLPELRELWQADCRKLIPEFELFDFKRMARAVEIAAEGIPDGSKLQDIEIIAAVLRNLDEADPAFGVPPVWWWQAASLIILPDVELSPWTQILWWAYYTGKGKRELLTFWGSASSGKSQGFTMIALVNSVIWCGASHVFITCPFKTSAEDKIFRFIKLYTEDWAVRPPDWMKTLELTCVSNKFDICFRDADNRTSNIVLVSLENPASVQGKKSEARFFQNEDSVSKVSIMEAEVVNLADLISRARFLTLVGIVLLIGDEVLQNPTACANLLTAEANLVSNANVLTMTGMNPRSSEVNHPMALELSEPDGRSVESLKENEDYTWPTKRGRLFRLSMDISPNRHAVTPLFPYLINYAQAQAQSKRGNENYLAQSKAWGWGDGAGNGGVLTEAAIKNEAWQQDPIWKSERRRWLAVDLAFGGDDPAGYCCLEAGVCQENGADRSVISAVESDVMKVERNWKPTLAEVEEFRRLAEERGGTAPNLISGKEYRGGDAHMCLQMLRVAKRLGIPKGMVTFDSSLRADVTLMARACLAHTAWYYDGQRQIQVEQEAWPLWPPEILPGGELKRWSDCHRRLISAIWRFSEHVIVRGNVRNLSKVQKGCFELITRRWKQASDGNKVDVEGKKELTGDKARGMKSPVYGETLAIAIMFGVRFCNALPDLSKEKPVIQGRSPGFTQHSVFKIRSRNVSAALWR